MSGVPCLISDQTPWCNLAEHNAGWDLPLNTPNAFAEKIDAFADMTPKLRSNFKDTARTYGEKRWRDQKAIDETRLMYKNATQKNQNK